MNTTEDTFLSPEERRAYQDELIEAMFLRNDSLSERQAKRWIEKRIKAGDRFGVDGIKNPSRMKEQIAHEMYGAGLEVWQTLKRSYPN